MKHKHILMTAIILLLAAVPLRAWEVRDIEPAVWWIGMENPDLQLVVEGKNIADVPIRIDYTGITVRGIAHTSNPDIAIVYLRIAPNTKPGKVAVKFGRQKKKKILELRARPKTPVAQGITGADVLYAIRPHTMEDRKKVAHVLDHLDSLGVTAIVVPSVQQNMEGVAPGRAITDYYRVDPRFGGEKAWREFVEAAHAKGLKVVMDMNLNHCGRGHRWTESAPDRNWFNQQQCVVEKTRPERASHYTWVRTDPYAPETEKELLTDGWLSPSMPDLNTENRYLSRYMTENSLWWTENYRLDGICVPTYPYTEASFRAGWAEAMRKQYPEIGLVCGSSGIRMDFDLATAMQCELSRESRTDKGLGAGLFRIYESIARDGFLSQPTEAIVFSGSERGESLIGKSDPVWKWKQAIALMLTTRGIPQINSGMEYGVPGDREKRDECRNWIGRLLEWRKTSRAVTTGKLVHYTPDNEHKCYVYARQAEGETVLVIMSGSDRDVNLPMHRFREVIGPHTIGTDIQTGRTIDLRHPVHLGAREVIVMELK